MQAEGAWFACRGRCTLQEVRAARLRLDQSASFHGEWAKNLGRLSGQQGTCAKITFLPPPPLKHKVTPCARSAVRSAWRVARLQCARECTCTA
eukprot:363625-Chlamydomonas_euryale.AAC.13